MNGKNQLECDGLYLDGLTTNNHTTIIALLVGWSVEQVQTIQLIVDGLYMCTCVCGGLILIGDGMTGNFNGHCPLGRGRHNVKKLCICLYVLDTFIV